MNAGRPGETSRAAAADWHPALLQHWYAVARSDAVRARPLGIVLFDRALVLARLAEGRVIALEDRCPHRGAPLSEGCVVGDGLACPYHGWRFGADGRLLELPGAPAGFVLPPVRVPALAVREHDGLVWLRPAAEGLADPPALAMTLPPAHRRYLYQSRWSAHVLDALENFLDALHTHHLHPGLVRRGGPATPVRVSFRGTDGGFHVDYDAPPQSGWLYRLFESPRTLERAHFAAPATAQIEYRWRRGGRARITLHFAPRDAASTEVFASLHVEGRWAPAWAVRWLLWPFLARVAEQDRRMLGLQAENLRRFPGRRHAVTSLDVVRPALERFWRGDGLPGADFDRELDLLL